MSDSTYHIIKPIVIFICSAKLKLFMKYIGREDLNGGTKGFSYRLLTFLLLLFCVKRRLYASTI